MRSRTVLLAVGLAGGSAAATAVQLLRRPRGPVPVDLPGRPRLVRPAGGHLAHAAVVAGDVPSEVPPRAGRLLLGRAASADLRLHEATVSLRHAELDIAVDGRVTVRDLGSDNGVRVDGVPVLEQELHDGERLELGDVALVFHRDAVDG